MEEPVKPKEKNKIDLRVQFLHKPIKKKLFRTKCKFLIQNEPFEYGIKVKNIGTLPFSGATIKEFCIRNGTIKQVAQNESRIKALNPGEEYELYIDKYTFWHEGTIFTECELLPDNNNEEIQVYQYHVDHDQDEPCQKMNSWFHDYYCQSQQQLLQTRTNNLILLLTGITVLEAIWGIKNILTFIAGSVAWIFQELHMLFLWLANF